MSASFVTVGAGQAAVSAVRMLRRRGFDGRVTMIGDEPHAPYQRPPLSKEYLRGDADLDDLTILDEEWAQANDVELRLGSRVESVDPTARRLRLADGASVSADLLMLATGARARRLPGVPAGDRVVHLRGRDDADRLRALLPGAARLAVIGSGLIGSEVAASARDLGVAVTCLEVAAWPLLGQLGPEMARVYAELHRENGVDLRCGRRVESVTEGPDTVRVRAEDGEVLDADLLVVAVGAEPNVELATSAGLALDPVNGGIVVDGAGRTSADGVFAAGDLASRVDPATGRGSRSEHVDNANRQGAAVARAVLGKPAVDDEPPWFWSDQYELGLQFVGRPRADATVVVRGSLADREFTAFYLHEGRVHAAFAVERGGDVPAARQLITEGVRVAEAALADEDADLFELLDSVTT